jgi:tetratricopeptide (TPR) repeat protein
MAAKGTMRNCFLLRAIAIGISLLAVASLTRGQEGDWQQQVQDEVRSEHMESALAIVEQRLVVAPNDWEAHGWRARLLSWKGRWPEGEKEYELVLENFPNDLDMLTGLSDVLIWQHKYSEALAILRHAKSISPSGSEILMRLARVLTLLGRVSEAQLEYQTALQLDPQNGEAKAVLLANSKHELRVGSETEFLSFASNAETQAASLGSRWSRSWSTVLTASTYQRFGQDAVELEGSAAFHITSRTWVSAGAGGANAQGIVPTHEAIFELGHGFRFDNPWAEGLESSCHQQWFWYQGAHVLTLSTSQIVYLPKGWTWSINLTGARTGFAGTAVAWEPAGWTKLAFPMHRRLTGDVLYGVGSENFFQIDQIEQFSAHTYGGGLRYQFTYRQDVQAYLARQNRSQGQTDTTLGFNYGIRF